MNVMLDPTPKDLAGAVLSIDLAAIQKNWRYLKSHAGTAKSFGVGSSITFMVPDALRRLPFPCKFHGEEGSRPDRKIYFHLKRWNN